MWQQKANDATYSYHGIDDVAFELYPELVPIACVCVCEWKRTETESFTKCIVVSHHMIRNTFPYYTLWLNKIFDEENNNSEQKRDRLNEREREMFRHVMNVANLYFESINIIILFEVWIIAYPIKFNYRKNIYHSIFFHLRIPKAFVPIFFISISLCARIKKHETIE